MHTCLVFIDTVNHQGSSPPDIVDTLISQLFHSSSFDNDIKPVWVILFELSPLCFRVLPVKLNIFVPCLEVLCDVHLDALIGSNDHSGSAVQFKELGEDETSGACAKEENFDADWRAQLVETMDGTGGGFKEGRFFVSKIVDLVHFLLWAAEINMLSCD